MIQINLFTKQEMTHRLRKQMYDYQRGKMGGGWAVKDKLGVRDWHVHTTIFKITNKDLQCITGNSAQ